jgi:initiation factor 1A
MGKNLTGGNKQKGKKNHIPKQRSVPINDITPDNKNRFVAHVIKNLGSYHVNVEVYPTKDSQNALIPGSFRNRIWIKTGDYVLIEVSTELSGSNCYIIHKYDTNEINELVALGCLVIKENEKDVEIQFTDATNDEESFDINEI